MTPSVLTDAGVELGTIFSSVTSPEIPLLFSLVTNLAGTTLGFEIAFMESPFTFGPRDSIGRSKSFSPEAIETIINTKIKNTEAVILGDLRRIFKAFSDNLVSFPHIIAIWAVIYSRHKGSYFATNLFIFFKKCRKLRVYWIW